MVTVSSAVLIWEYSVVEQNFISAVKKFTDSEEAMRKHGQYNVTTAKSRKGRCSGDTWERDLPESRE